MKTAPGESQSKVYTLVEKQMKNLALNNIEGKEEKDIVDVQNNNDSTQYVMK